MQSRRKHRIRIRNLNDSKHTPKQASLLKKDDKLFLAEQGFKFVPRRDRRIAKPKLSYRTEDPIIPYWKKVVFFLKSKVLCNFLTKTTSKASADPKQISISDQNIDFSLLPPASQTTCICPTGCPMIHAWSAFMTYTYTWINMIISTNRRLLPSAHISFVHIQYIPTNQARNVEPSLFSD